MLDEEQVSSIYRKSAHVRNLAPGLEKPSRSPQPQDCTLPPPSSNLIGLFLMTQPPTDVDGQLPCMDLPIFPNLTYPHPAPS